MGPLDITFSLSSLMTGLLWQLLPAQAGLEGSALITFLALLGAGAIAGGFINGLAGFGTALFSLGFWLQIMPPQQAVALVLAMSVLSGIQGLILVRRLCCRKCRKGHVKGAANAV